MLKKKGKVQVKAADKVKGKIVVSLRRVHMKIENSPSQTAPVRPAQTTKPSTGTGKTQSANTQPTAAELAKEAQIKAQNDPVAQAYKKATSVNVTA